MEKLCEYFRVPGNMSFGDAVREVSLRLGNDGESVLHKVAAVYPHVTKQAATSELYIGNLVPCQLVENVLNAVDDYNTAQNAANVIKTASAPSKKETPEFLTGSILYNPVDEPLTLKEAAPKPPAPRPTGPSGVLKPLLGPAYSVAKAMGSASDAASSLDSSNNVKSQYNKLTDPEHETALRNIRSQGTIHDLMLNDPVISGYDPQEVALAYNEISDAAPNLGDSPAIMQAMMRKRLAAGQLGDFDVKQLLDMDKLRADRDTSVLQSRKLEQELLQ
jgi:hypothetical protein